MSEEKTSPIAKKIEMAANVAIVIAVVVLVLFFLRNRFPSQPPQISTGKQFALKEMDWQANDRSVVLALSTTCHFCNESAGFYRVLVNQCKQQHVRTIAVLPQSPEESRSYLQNEGVTVDEVRQAALPGLEINGTPTLLLVDKKGVVRNVWVGQLPPGIETEVLAKINAPS